MYRLLKHNSPTLNSLPVLSLNANSSLIEKSCHLCKILQSTIKVPHAYKSTIYRPVEQGIKIKKRRTRRSRVTELVEVSNESAVQLTTKVKKANAKNLDKLLKISTEINKINDPQQEDFGCSGGDSIFKNQCLSENDRLEKLSDKDLRILSMLGYSNFDNYLNGQALPKETTENICAESAEEIAELTDLLETPEDVLESTSIADKSWSEELIKETPEVKAGRKKKENEKLTPEIQLFIQKRKKEVMIKTVTAFVQTCVSQKLIKRAESAMNLFKSKTHNKFVLDDVTPYNELLKGYVDMKMWNSIPKVLQTLEEEKIKRNIQTYIVLLYGLEKSSQDDRCNFLYNYKRMLKKNLDQFKEEGYTFNELMNKGVFSNDERQIVLKAIRKFEPDFTPKYYPAVVQYTNELVNDLNHPDQLAPPKKKQESDGLFSSVDLRARVLEQFEEEQKISITIKNIEAKEEPSEEMLRCRTYLKELHKSWTEEATAAFKRDLDYLNYKRGTMSYDIFLKSIPIEDFVSIIVDEAKKLSEGSESYSPTVKMLHRDLGNKVYQRYVQIKRKNLGVLDKILSIHNEYCDHYAASHKKLDILPNQIDNLNSRQKWQWFENNLRPTGSTLDMGHKKWVPPVLAEIGEFLYRIIMQDLKVDSNCLDPNSQHKKKCAAFYSIFRYQNRKFKQEVKPRPELAKLIRAAVPETLTFPVNEVPMVCPPVPWTSLKNGGYLITPSLMVRLPSYAFSPIDALKSTPVENLFPVFDSLNQLGSVPWKVNTKILDVITTVFNSGGSAKLDIPQPPSSLAQPVPPPNLKDLDIKERRKFLFEKLEFQRRKAEMYSLRCDCLYRLCLAHHFRDKIFWLPHNIDFRGRVYPIPPHLNHLGADFARSMLSFAEARPLGPRGLDWLKIHLINLTGLKKRSSMEDRLQFANECMDLIFDSSDNPLDGKMWWTESDEPWQTLACCMEIADVVRSGDPENYRSHFPIHQDGSCNGLQHYAALGRDKVGGHSVNLCPADVPQDVYSAALGLVEESRKKDAANGIEIAQALEGFVKRKVIKQTIMTSVYGVTYFGARLQIIKQLKDNDKFPQDQVSTAATYLTKKTFESLRAMFSSAREIQDWFTECAKMITSVGGRHMQWVTPLGFPVVQPYIKLRHNFTKNALYKLYLIDNFEKINVFKHKNAFPPNFIHSLDASHMMLTSLNCERSGITFVSVHDCFWTHPSTVEIMNKICREQFVALHSQPILEDLSIYMSQKFGYNDGDFSNDGSITDLKKKKLNKVLCNLPQTGDLDIKNVYNSVYFFS